MSEENAGGSGQDDFFQGTGCNFCTHTGYKDRIGIYELLIMTRPATDFDRLGGRGGTQEELRDTWQ